MCRQPGSHRACFPCHDSPRACLGSGRCQLPCQRDTTHPGTAWVRLSRLARWGGHSHPVPSFPGKLVIAQGRRGGCIMESLPLLASFSRLEGPLSAGFTHWLHPAGPCQLCSPCRGPLPVTALAGAELGPTRASARLLPGHVCPVSPLCPVCSVCPLCPLCCIPGELSERAAGKNLLHEALVSHQGWTPGMDSPVLTDTSPCIPHAREAPDHGCCWVPSRCCHSPWQKAWL